MPDGEEHRHGASIGWTVNLNRTPCVDHTMNNFEMWMRRQLPGLPNNVNHQVRLMLVAFLGFASRLIDKVTGEWPSSLSVTMDVLQGYDTQDRVLKRLYSWASANIPSIRLSMMAVIPSSEL
jgi:hypothetical protein